MSSTKIQKVVIVGGGTAGWITASLLAKVLGKSLNISLVESDQIGTIGVGEATIPPIINFNNALGISEAEFLKATKGTIKLGIEFDNWGQQNDSYMHAFGEIGKNFPFCDFHHFYTKSKQLGSDSSFWDYSLNYQAAKNNKFAKIAKIEGINLPGVSYAYHFDAGLYAQFLRKFSENLGVKRIEGMVQNVELNNNTGFVDSLLMADGSTIAGDLFIDCTGLAALLIDKALNVGFDDWSHWLPCDRAIAVPSESSKSIIPYTRAIAHQSGWQWQIPLQNRIGNGLVYSSKHMTDEQAQTVLLDHLSTKALAEPKVIRFKTGRRRKQWYRNVVSIGLSSGFFEPLESTSLHLIQTAAIRLLKFFPHNGIQLEEVAEFNQQSKAEYISIRDFIILHYKLTKRDDSAFWRQCRQMEIPKTLQQKLTLFRKTGKVFCQQGDLFTDIAWKQVMIGQGNMPQDHHPLVNSLSSEQIEDLMANLKTLINRTVEKMPSHQDFINSL